MANPSIYHLQLSILFWPYFMINDPMTDLGLPEDIRTSDQYTWDLLYKGKRCGEGQ